MVTWNTASDWDAAASEVHVHHESPAGSGWAAADVIEKGPTIPGSASLVGYWPLHGGGGSDIAGTNDLTVGNTGSATGGPGDFGYGQFDGADDYSTASDSLSTGDSPRTYLGWMYNQDNNPNTKWGRMLNAGSGNCTGKHFGLDVRNGNLAVWGGCQDREMGLAVTDLTWQFFAVRYDGFGTVKAWLDSLTDSWASGSFNFGSDGNIYFGKNPNNNEHWNGRLAHVMIFNTSVGDSTINSIREHFTANGSLITSAKVS